MREDIKLSSKVKTVLITAFEPFGNETVNASAMILDALPDEIGGMKIEKALLPVVFCKAKEEAVKAMADAGVPARLSDTAETFVCNDLMYGMLYELSEKKDKKDVPCGFSCSYAARKTYKSLTERKRR